MFRFSRYKQDDTLSVKLINLLIPVLVSKVARTTEVCNSFHIYFEVIVTDDLFLYFILFVVFVVRTWRVRLLLLFLT